MKHVVILGAGVAGLEAALALRDLAKDAVSVEVVSHESEFVYRPLAVAAPFRLGEARRFPVSHLLDDTGASLTQAEASTVAPDRQTVITSTGERPYDYLLVALGAKPVAAIAGADVTFRGPQDEVAFGDLLREAREGRVNRIVFTMPHGLSWPLPLYELALLTAVHLADAGALGVKIDVVTPEPQPLQLFGPEASEAIAELFELHGIGLETETVPLGAADGVLQFAGGRELEADRVVALPRLEGPRLMGLPQDAAGFIPVDEHQTVRGWYDVFAAGDATDFPVKQGGLATQQADAAAQAIAKAAGVDIDAEPFRPVLRGLLLTGLTPRFLRAEVGKHQAEVDTESLWWPPAKIVGRYLAPFLADHLELSTVPPGGTSVQVDVELDRGPAGAWLRI
jgi:sulfide:quinone oxidoreductase